MIQFFLKTLQNKAKASLTTLTNSGLLPAQTPAQSKSHMPFSTLLYTHISISLCSLHKWYHTHNSPQLASSLNDV